jgi:ribonuclease D
LPAIDTETMGLDPRRDRLCVVQLSPGDGIADVVQVPVSGADASRVAAPNLVRLLVDGNILKIFHFARFDLGVLHQGLGIMPGPVYCTKIASRLGQRGHLCPLVTMGGLWLFERPPRVCRRAEPAAAMPLRSNRMAEPSLVLIWCGERT